MVRKDWEYIAKTLLITTIIIILMYYFDERFNLKRGLMYLIILPTISIIARKILKNN